MLVRGLEWGAVEFSVVKENCDAEVSEVAVYAGDVLEGLYRRAKASARPSDTGQELQSSMSSRCVELTLVTSCSAGSPLACSRLRDSSKNAGSAEGRWYCYRVRSCSLKALARPVLSPGAKGRVLS